MRFVVFGAGAVGGAIGARMAEHGHDVVLIARGEQYRAIRESGLRIESNSGVRTLPLAVVANPREIEWTRDDVALLTMKTQDTQSAVLELAGLAPPELPVVCAQNSVENERIASRWFSHVYGICVMCPTSFVMPGIVQAWSSPVTGILDIGRYPSGIDSIAEAIAAAFRRSTFLSEPRTDIMRWKYTKLLMNLGNAIEALSGNQARYGPMGDLVRAEAIACFEAAGIAYASDEEDRTRRGDTLRPQPIEGREKQGGSTWQSFQRRKPSIETDYLNGEIALLGRLHGIPTPVNSLLQRLANQMALEGKPPEAMPAEELARAIHAACVGSSARP